MKKPAVFLALFGAIGVVAFLLQAGFIGPRSAPRPEVELLLTAARRGDLAGVEKALAEGADVDAREPSNKETALLRAARMGEAEVARALLAAGADPDLGTRLSLTPLHVAARAGAAEVIAALIAAGAQVDAHEDEQGLTPLHDAVSALQVEAVRVLLAAGADPDARMTHYRSPALFTAIGESNLEIATLLVHSGADVNARNAWGWAIHQVLTTAHDEDPDMMRLLVGAGASLSSKDKEGRTVLEAARYYFAHEQGASYIARRRATVDALEQLTGAR